VEKARKSLDRRKGQIVAYYGYIVGKGSKCAI